MLSCHCSSCQKKKEDAGSYSSSNISSSRTFVLESAKSKCSLSEKGSPFIDNCIQPKVSEDVVNKKLINSTSYTITRNEGLSSIEEEPITSGSNDYIEAHEFYAGEGEILAARGELFLGELLQAVKKGRARRGIADPKPERRRHSTCNNVIIKEESEKPPSIVIRNRGNQHLFKGLSEILQKKEPITSGEHASTFGDDQIARNQAAFYRRESSGFLSHNDSLEFGISQLHETVSDRRLHMMLFGKKREARKAALARILTDRNLGHIAQCLIYKSFKKDAYCGEDLSERKNRILSKVKEITSRKLSSSNMQPCYNDLDIYSYSESQSSKEVSSSVLASESFNRLSRNPLIPTIVVTPPSEEMFSSSNPNKMFDELQLEEGHREIIQSSMPESHMSETESVAVHVGSDTKAFVLYEEALSRANPLMKSALMSSKWEVLSYLSGRRIDSGACGLRDSDDDNKIHSECVQDEETPKVPLELALPLTIQL